MPVKITEEQMRRLAEATQQVGLKLDEEVRAQVEQGRTPEFYLGFVGGVMSAMLVSRSLLTQLREVVEAEADGAAELSGTFAAVAVTIELITMRTTKLAAVAAELYFKSRG